MNDVEAHELVTTTARSARVAQRSLARAPRAVKDAALEAMARLRCATRAERAVAVTSSWASTSFMGTP